MKDLKRIQAIKKVEEIKKFYKHLTIYLLINFFFIFRRIYKDIQFGDSFFEAIIDVSNYSFFYWWGVALIFHAIATFGIPNLLGKNWEERKIKEFMNK